MYNDKLDKKQIKAYHHQTNAYSSNEYTYADHRSAAWQLAL